MKVQIPTAVRLVNSIQVVNDCWEWQLFKDKDGYGQTFYWDGSVSDTIRAPRLSYETFIGKIPNGKVLDHICRNRLCINPTHLDVVTSRENTQRGFPGRNQDKTHCPQGHEYSEANTSKHVIKGGYTVRTCRTCGNNRGKLARLRRRSTDANG